MVAASAVVERRARSAWSRARSDPRLLTAVKIGTLVSTETNGIVKRSALVSWRGGELRVGVRVPLAFAPEQGDLSPFVAMALLPAMIRGEDLEVQGSVSTKLLDGLDLAIAAYASWDPGLRPPAIRAPGPPTDVPQVDGVGCFFSRGVDSMYSAALERREPAALTHLVFCDGIEPIHSPGVAREEVARAGIAAARLSLPLVIVETNARALSHELCDWGDAHGAVLAAIGLMLGGGLGTVLIPSTTTFATVGPFGSSPVLDGLFSTESVAIVHDDISLTRAGKVAALATQRPDLLAHLKVCYAENRSDNCGRCGKCLITMAALQAAGALALARDFPPQIDLGLVKDMSLFPLETKMQWAAVIRALGEDGANRQLRRAMSDALRRSARPGVVRRFRYLIDRLRGRRPRLHPAWRDPARGFDWRHQAEVLSLLHYGEPLSPIGAQPEPPLIRRRLRPAGDSAPVGEDSREPDGVSFDSPLDGEVVAGRFLHLHGWARREMTLDRIEVTVGDRAPEPVRLYATPRPDVAEFFGDERAALSGWSHRVDLSGLSPGSQIEVVVESVEDGERNVFCRRELIVGGQDKPAIHPPGWIAALSARTSRAAGEHVPCHDGLRLLVVTHSLAVGGAELHLREILRVLLQDHDTSCHVLAPRDGVLRGELEALGATVHLTGTVLLPAAEYECRLLELVHMSSAEGFNAVLANTLGTFIGVDLALRCGIPAVWTLHEPFTLEEFLDEALGPTLDEHVIAQGHQALASASAVTFVADATRELHAAHGDPRRHRLVEYGIPLQEFDEYRAAQDRTRARASHGFSASDFVIVSVALIQPRKGQGSLVAAFARIAKEFPDAVLVMVGDMVDAYGAALGRMIEGLQLDDRIRRIPLVGDPRIWLTMADAFVLASDRESLPRALIEAMAFELPVLATAVGGVPRLIEDGVTGLSCAPSDIRSLKEGLSRLLAMAPDDRAAMAARGAALVRATRDSHSYTQAHRTLIRALVADGHSPPDELLEHS